MMSCVGILLAGGKSSRMGTDKASLRRFGESMLCFSRRVLRQAGCDGVLVSGNRVNALADKYPGIGPIGGIASAFNSPLVSEANGILVLPVDLPLITPRLLGRLLHEGKNQNKPCYFENHFLPCYIPVNANTREWLASVLDKYETQLNNPESNTDQGKAPKGPSVKALLSAHDAVALTCNAPEQLINTNTPQQWKQAKQALTIKESGKCLTTL